MEILPLCFKFWTICSLWRPVRYYSSVSKFFYDSYSCVTVLVLFSFTLLEFVDIALNFGNVDDFTSNAFLFLTMIGVCYKVAHTFMKRLQIICIRDMLYDEICRPENMEEQRILDNCANACRSNTVNLGIIIMSSIVFFLVGPLLHDVNDRVLPFRAWLPYSLSSLPVFYLTYLHQSLAIISAGLVSVASDTFISGLMIQACGQLDILKCRLANLHESHNFEMAINDTFHREETILKMCIRHHNHIFKFAALVEKTFNHVVLFQCFISAFVVCTTTLTLLNHQLLSIEFITIIVYFLSIVFQLLVYCWYGNEVILKSIEVTDAVFEMDWIRLPALMKKDLIMIMMRAERAIKFTSGYVLTLSLDSYVAILKLSYTTFNVLQRSS
ncbi:Odorant receptor 46 [Cephus cinctus]|nr:Odorant receptor 46 [Cephus cinctus]